MLLKRTHRGLSTIIALLVMSILVVIVFAISAQGVWNMNFVNKDKARKIAFYAAEAGVNEALLKYKNNEANWRNGIGKQSDLLALTTAGVQYYVQVTENFRGSSSVIAPNGVSVSPSMAYFLGTGIIGVTTKQVGVMVRDNVKYYNRYAIQSAGNLKLKNTNTWGTIKCSGNLTIDSNLEVHREEIWSADRTKLIRYGNGRVLCSKSIDNKKLVMAEPDSSPVTVQDVRARTGISDLGKVDAEVLSGIEQVYQNDISKETDPFVNDSVNDSPVTSSGGERLPYPDMSKILDGSETTYTDTSWSKDILSGVHVFTNGVTLTNKCLIKGNCTIVVYGPLVLECKSPGVGSGDPIVHIIVFDNTADPLKKASITAKSEFAIKGVIFCQRSISTQGNFDCIGTVISYNDNQSHTGAQSNFTFSKDIVSQCPAFSAWYGNNALMEIDIASWQRL